MGLLWEMDICISTKGTSKDRQESMVFWKLTIEHFRRECPSDKAAERFHLESNTH